MELETDRLVLRPLARSDLDAWCDFLGDPQATRLLHTPEAIPDRDRATAALERWLERQEEPLCMYALHLRDGGETAGFVGFVPRELPWGPELELGWLLRRRHWGRGLASEAARALRPLAPSRVVSLIRAENAASARVAEKLGMTIERSFEYYGFATNLWVSSAPA
jgi:RimJ/RimL family protein N-acetyltransferase